MYLPTFFPVYLPVPSCESRHRKSTGRVNTERVVPLQSILKSWGSLVGVLFEVVSPAPFSPVLLSSHFLNLVLHTLRTIGPMPLPNSITRIPDTPRISELLYIVQVGSIHPGESGPLTLSSDCGQHALDDASLDATWIRERRPRGTPRRLSCRGKSPMVPLDRD